MASNIRTYVVVLPRWRRNTDIHLRRLSRDNLTFERVLAKKNLTAISLVNRYSRTFAQNLSGEKNALWNSIEYSTALLGLALPES